MNKLKQNSAITLIALVITIIVLLILAAVTLNIVLGENGIFTKARTSKNSYEYSSAKETLSLKLLEIQTDCIEKNQDYTIEIIADKLEQTKEETIEIMYYYGLIAQVNSSANAKPTSINGIVVIVNPYTQYKFLIGEKQDGGIGIIGVSTTTSTTPVKTDFEELDTFEKEKLGKVITNNSVEINKKANKELRDLLGSGNIEMTVQDIINSETMKEKLFASDNIKSQFEITALSDMNKLLNSGKSIDEILEIAQISEVKLEDILDSESLITKICENNLASEYLQDEENKATLAKISSNETATSIMQESNKALYVETKRIDITLMPGSNNTGTVSEINGEYILTECAILESQETMQALSNFTLYVETKDLAKYYPNVQPYSESVAGLIIGVGSPGGGTQSITTGISYGWGGEVLNGFSGTGYYPGYNTSCLTDGWNRLALTYDGTIFKFYINGVCTQTCNSANFKNTKLYIGGWGSSPMSASGADFGFANGKYRNIKVYSIALEQSEL